MVRGYLGPRETLAPPNFKVVPAPPEGPYDCVTGAF